VNQPNNAYSIFVLFLILFINHLNFIIMFELFVAGGVPCMTVLTINLLALLLAAWKAPAWVKEIGIIALVVGIIFFLMGIYIAGDMIERVGEVSQSIIWGGFKLAVITPIYGFLIYLVSLVILIIRKPRI